MIEKNSVSPPATGRSKKSGLASVALQKPQSLAALAAEHIRAAIIEARLHLGEALSEDKIAASLNVSRTPVREALGMLQMQGLIEILPKTGSFVFLPSSSDIAALAEYRLMLEQHGTALALQRAPEAYHKELKKVVAAMNRAAAAEDAIGYARADDLFHRAAFTHCDNSYLLEAYNAISGRVAALRSHQAIPLKFYQTSTHQEHKDILAAVEARDAKRLHALITHHITVMRHNYVQALEDGLIHVPTARPRSKGPRGSSVRKNIAQGQAD